MPSLLYNASMSMKLKEFKAVLKSNGWEFVRDNSGHLIYKKENKTFSLPKTLEVKRALVWHFERLNRV